MNIIETLKKAIQLNERFISYFKEKEIEPNELVKIAMVERYGITFKNLVQLLRILENDSSIDYSITLLLRAALLDTHFVFFLVACRYNYLSEIQISETTEHKLDENIEIEVNQVETEISKIIEKEVEKMYISQLKFYFKDILRIKDNGFFTEEQYNQTIKAIINRYRFCFQDEINHTNPLGSLKTTEYTSPQKMYHEIQKFHKGYGLSYDYYSIFSKVEHFGVLTYQFTRINTPKMIVEQCVGILLVGLQYSMAIADRTKPENIEIGIINDTIQQANFKWTW